MRLSALPAAVVLLLVGALMAADAKDEKTPLEGNWEATSASRNGKDAPADEVKKHNLTVKGKQFNYEMFRTIVKGKITLNADKKPKEIDVTYEGSTRKGIYELKGDTLRLCFPTRAADRPTEFTGKAGFQLTEFKKTK